MRELQVGISYEDECFIVGYFTEKGRTQEEVVIPFTEVTPVLSELLRFLEPALSEQAEQPEKGRVISGGEGYHVHVAFEQPVRDNLACAEVKLDKIDELTAQVHAHLAAERAYISGEAGYYR